MMNIQLIQGEFNANDALELITQLIHVKIKYHENKINLDTAEEDIKLRESKIKRLQKELYDFQKIFASSGKNVKLNSVINVN